MKLGVLSGLEVWVVPWMGAWGEGCISREFLQHPCWGAAGAPGGHRESTTGGEGTSAQPRAAFTSPGGVGLGN